MFFHFFSQRSDCQKSHKKRVVPIGTSGMPLARNPRRFLVGGVGNL